MRYSQQFKNTDSYTSQRVNLKTSLSAYFKNSAAFICLILLTACGGGSDERPCARSEDACLIIEPPAIEIWWDAPITDFSEDPDRPTISLLGEKTIILALGDNYIEAGATATDEQDGDLTAAIEINGQVNNAEIGDYVVRYSVTDSTSKLALEEIRIVRVIGSTAENFSRRPIGSTIANFSYLEHLPVDYGQTAMQPPLIIYLHGGGGNLEFTDTKDPTLALEAVIDNYGIPKLIEDGDWDSTLPFVVLAPHLGSVPSAGYKARLDAFVEYAMRAYDIDSSRIYLTGYSQGGFLSAAYAKDFPDKIAAAAAVSPAFDDNVDPIINNFCGIERVPLWMFHATNDEVIPFSNTINVYQAIIDNCQALELPKLSLVVGAEHAIHHAVFNLEALEGGFAQAVYDSRFDTYDMSIYQWLLSHNLENR